jgi:hypothetical protein
MADDQAATIQGLRDLADFLEQHPQLPPVTYAHAAIHIYGEMERGELEATLAAVSPARIEADSPYNDQQVVRREFGPLKFTLRLPSSVMVERAETVVVRQFDPDLAAIAAGDRSAVTA